MKFLFDNKKKRRAWRWIPSVYKRYSIGKYAVMAHTYHRGFQFIQIKVEKCGICDTKNFFIEDYLRAYKYWIKCCREIRKRYYADRYNR